MILRNMRPGRPVDVADFSDLTSSVQTGPAYWLEGEVDTLVVPMDVDPSATEVAAIRRRLATADAAEEAHVADMAATAQDASAPEWARGVARAELARFGL